MVIQPGKTKVLILSSKTFIGPVQDITMDDCSLEIMDHHKVLYVTVDNKLSWNKYTDNTTKLCNTKVKKLKRMRSVGSETLNEFYYKAIIPSVTYNIQFGVCSMKKLDKLDEIHTEASRTIFNLDNQLSYEECLLKANWHTITYLYKRRLLCMMHKIYYNTIDHRIYSNFKRAATRANARRQHNLKYHQSKRLKTNSFSYRRRNI